MGGSTTETKLRPNSYNELGLTQSGAIVEDQLKMSPGKLGEETGFMSSLGRLGPYETDYLPQVQALISRKERGRGYHFSVIITKGRHIV